MLLAVELEEGSQIGPAQIDTGHEVAVPVSYNVLAFGLRCPANGTHQLHHERLEQALGRGSVRGTQRQDPPDPCRAGHPPTPQLGHNIAYRRDGYELLPQRGLEGLLPYEVVDLCCQVEHGAQRVRAGDAIELNPLRYGNSTPSLRS
jgi:hypothetical protein